MAKDKAKALERLRRILDEIPELKLAKQGSAQFQTWWRNTKRVITLTFGETSPHAKSLADLIYQPWIVSLDTSEHEYRQAYERDLEIAQGLIKSMIVEIEEDLTDPEPTLGITADFSRIGGRKVFIVHGHDQNARDAMARFAERVDLEPVILLEQASQGNTIIEKFEVNSNVGYAVVLLTGDDIGGNQDEDGRMQPRARQNVIFELGFFIGKLGRERVCALTKGNPEIPSDYSGVVYIPMDEGDAWQGKLVKELKAAGFDIDANKLYD